MSKCLWIVKPPAKAHGNGIKVISKWKQSSKTRPMLVQRLNLVHFLELHNFNLLQRYIAKPYLIKGAKFDLRLYVLITSINPLRIYLYDDGLVRFASKPYSSNTATASDVFTHLTNYSINKRSESYLSNEDSLLAQVGGEIDFSLTSTIRSSGTQVDFTSFVEIF